jgi:DNA invertase Pin-like site-specific DNA recombinase
VHDHFHAANAMTNLDSILLHSSVLSPFAPHFSMVRHAKRDGTKNKVPSAYGQESVSGQRGFYRHGRLQFMKVRSMLGQQAVGIAQIAKETSLTRQTVYRIKDDPAGAEAASVVWGL